MKIWELKYTCAAHSDRIVRFAAPTFQEAFEKAEKLITAPWKEHGPHGGYTHSIVRLDFITEFEVL